jgi:hypothetical protein
MWRYRIATPEDRTFYIRVYTSTRAEEIVLVGWIAKK